MSYREMMPAEDKFKQVKITFKERIREVLSDIVNGMDFLKPDRPWAESLFIALRKHIKKEDGIVLEMDPDYGNMLREIDAILLEAKVTSVLIENIQRDLDSETRSAFKDRKLKSRKPTEDLHIFLISN